MRNQEKTKKEIPQRYLALLDGKIQLEITEKTTVEYAIYKKKIGVRLRGGHFVVVVREYKQFIGDGISESEPPSLLSEEVVFTTEKLPLSGWNYEE